MTTDLTQWGVLLRKYIGIFGDHDSSNPYKPFPPVADLARGWGTPPGFKKMHFTIMEHANDARLNPEGLARVAQALRHAADEWLLKECQENGLWACKTPQVHIQTGIDPAMDRRFVQFCLTAYVYPPLTAKVETKLEEKV